MYVVISQTVHRTENTDMRLVHQGSTHSCQVSTHGWVFVSIDFSHNINTRISTEQRRNIFSDVDVSWIIYKTSDSFCSLRTKSRYHQQHLTHQPRKTHLLLQPLHLLLLNVRSNIAMKRVKKEKYFDRVLTC